MTTTLVDPQGRVTRRMAFETTKVLKDCCVSMLAEAKPRFFGEQSKCTLCDNRVKTVEANVYPVSDMTGRYAEVMASRTGHETPVAVKRLVFTKKRFASSESAKDWAKKNGFLAPQVAATAETWIIRQAPEDWFGPTVYPRVMRLTDGVIAEIGARKSEFKNRAATVKDITDTIGRPAPSAAPKVKKDEAAPDKGYVEKTENGACPVGFPVKWAGVCWSTKAAAQGFPGSDDLERAKKAEKQFVPFASPDKPSVEPTEGKCPATHPVLMEGMCWTKAAADAKAKKEKDDTEKQFVPFAAKPASKKPDANGKCPEGWELKDGVCVEVKGPGAPEKK